MELNIDRIRQHYEKLPEIQQKYPRKDLNFKTEDAGDRTISFLGSTGDIDRMRDVILHEAWELKNFRQNPVFLWCHDYKQPPIGRAKQVMVTKRGLEFRVEFAETDFANTVYKLYKKKFLHAVSVGFIPLEWRHAKKGDPVNCERVYTRCELLELSAVPIPANPAALQLAFQRGHIPTRNHLQRIEKAVVIDVIAKELRKLSDEMSAASRTPPVIMEASISNQLVANLVKQYGVAQVCNTERVEFARQMARSKKWKR